MLRKRQEQPTSGTPRQPLADSRGSPGPQCPLKMVTPCHPQRGPEERPAAAAPSKLTAAMQVAPAGPLRAGGFLCPGQALPPSELRSTTVKLSHRVTGNDVSTLKVLKTPAFQPRLRCRCEERLSQGTAQVVCHCWEQRPSRPLAREGASRRTPLPVHTVPGAWGALHGWAGHGHTLPLGDECLPTGALLAWGRCWCDEK